VRASVAGALEAALDPVFLALVPLAAVGVVLALAPREQPLRRTQALTEAMQEPA